MIVILRYSFRYSKFHVIKQSLIGTFVAGVSMRISIVNFLNNITRKCSTTVEGKCKYLLRKLKKQQLWNMRVVRALRMVQKALEKDWRNLKRGEVRRPSREQN